MVVLLVFQALRKLMQENYYKIEANLGYIVISRPEKLKNK